MTGRAFGTVLTGTVLLLAGLTLGSAAFFLCGVMLLCLAGTGLVLLILNRLLLRISQSLDPAETDRGGECRLVLRACLRLPVLSALLSLSVLTPAGETVPYVLRLRTFGTTVSHIVLPCPHACETSAGLTGVILTDSFGFFRTRIRFFPLPLTVLPVPAQTAFPEEGSGRPRPGIAQGQDLPEDLRNWQEGDELHRIHWKVSMRRAVLTVRTYEAQQESEFLILMAGTAESVPNDITDALLERCAGLTQDVIAKCGRLRVVLPDGSETDHPAPVFQDLPVFRKWLSGVCFEDSLPPRELLLRQLGANHQAECAAVLLPCLDAELTELLLQLYSLTGSLLLVLCKKADAEEETLLQRLRASGMHCLPSGGEM